MFLLRIHLHGRQGSEGALIIEKDQNYQNEEAIQDRNRS